MIDEIFLMRKSLQNLKFDSQIPLEDSKVKVKLANKD